MALQKAAYLSDVWKNGIFANKVVFCTGGNGTICSAQVRALVHLGANACIVGRNPEKTEAMARSLMTAREGSRVLGIGAIDVRNADSVKGAVDQCVQELGAVDFCIAGAAGNFLSPISALSPNAFKSVIDIDVLGSYNTAKACLPHLLKSAKANPAASTSISTATGGRFIFVSATIHYTGSPLQTHVNVAKAGVDALSANIAIEYGPFGLTSNVIAPGPIAGTEGMDRLSSPDSSQNLNGWNSSSSASASSSLPPQPPSFKPVPLGRCGTVKEIADATVWLFSDAANYVNGEVVVVDGAAWRTSGAALGSGGRFTYPDFLTDEDGAFAEALGGKRSGKNAKQRGKSKL